MIIIRKYFSDNEKDQSKNPKYSKDDYKRIGEALGTVGVGAAGMYGATGLVNKTSNLLIQRQKKKAVSKYLKDTRAINRLTKSQIKLLADEVKSRNKKAAERYVDAVKRHNGSLFGKRKLVRDAEDNLKRVTSAGKIWFNKRKNKLVDLGNQYLSESKKNIMSNRDKNISRISKGAKGAKLGILAAGTALTGLSVASLLRNKNKENKDN